MKEEVKLVFSSIYEQEQTSQVIILDQIFNLPPKVIVTKYGIINLSNNKLNSNLENQINDYINKYNSLEQINNLLNNID